jgi:N-acetyl-alpha-D-glucosaminyl L-malate synthase BshA
VKKLTIGITCYPSIGGSGIVATSLGYHLAKLGHSVHFISYEKPFRFHAAKNIRFHKVDINEYELFRYPDYTLPLAVKMADVHEKFGLDIMHVHYAVPHATAALLACAMLKQCDGNAPKIVTTLHGTDITLLARDASLYSVIKFSIEKSNAVTSVSADLKKDTQRILDTQKHIEVIPNFYDPKPARHSVNYMRKKLGVKPDDFMAIHLSNLRPVKRIGDLLKITAALKKYPKFKLLVIGAGSFNAYRKIVNKLKIANQIIVKQDVSDIENYIHAADIGLFTSETESFGLGILEVLAYGKPVVSSRVGGIPEVVNHNITGFLSPKGNIESFTKQIERLMENPELSVKMGNAARLEAKEKFSSDKVVAQYLEYYYKTLKL